VPNLAGRKVVAVACGGCHSAILLEDGTPLFFGDNAYNKLTVPDFGDERATAVACGDDHSAIIINDKLVIFGRYKFDQVDNIIFKSKLVLFKKIDFNKI